MSQNASDSIKECRSYVLSALVQTMEARFKLDWVANERMAVAVAANDWAEAHGHQRRITVGDIERIEVNAMGHTDYASKLALYTAEFLIDPQRWQVTETSLL